MSSEGAAGASAAARRRGSPSRKAQVKARAPAEDTPRRPRAMRSNERRLADLWKKTSRRTMLLHEQRVVERLELGLDLRALRVVSDSRQIRSEESARDR